MATSSTSPAKGPSSDATVFRIPSNVTKYVGYSSSETYASPMHTDLALNNYDSVGQRLDISVSLDLISMARVSKILLNSVASCLLRGLLSLALYSSHAL